MSNIIGDFSKEVIGAISTGFLVIIMIMFFSALGETTGQTELSNSMINALLLVLAIGLPIGVISLIKWLLDLKNEYG
jgi:predicted Na+-dependent transporter